MAQEVVTLTRHPNYVVVSINRPEKRNALNQAVLEGLDKALASVEGDDEIRALILRGEGKSFCAGIDLGEVSRVEAGHNPTNLEHVFHRLEKLPAITIAAVQGAALAGGLELALHCDLRIASENARLGMTVARVGLVVPYDFGRKLIEVIGAANTAWILYTAAPVDAATSLRMGMVNEVVPDGQLDKRAGEIADQIAGNAPLALRAMKAALLRSMSLAFDAEHQDILEMARAARQSEDAKEGVRAFLEKRKPVWRAR